MSFLIENWYLLVLALVSGIGLALPVLRGGAGLGLQPQAAVQRINRDKAVVVDVREAEEYAAGHITNAKHIPLAQIEERLPQVVKNKTLPVIFVCATSPRSTRAQTGGKKTGLRQARGAGRWHAAWARASLPVVKS